MGRRSRRRDASSDPKVATSKPPGARIARVSVDDATWESFRALCGSVPASVRLGELVQAEVRRANGSEVDSRKALQQIRARLDTLEQLLPP
jgi:hypothetical protein